MTRSFEHAVSLGGGGAFSRAWAASDAGRAKIGRVTEADVHPTALRARAPQAGGLVLDEEHLPLAEASVDLIVAPLSLHLVNDLPGALIQIRRALKPDGLLVAALFARGTLAELRAAFLEADTALLGAPVARIAPLPELQDIAGLLQRAGLAMPVADLDTTCVRYADPMRLFADLRVMGETSALAAMEPGPHPAPAPAQRPQSHRPQSHRPLSRRLLARALSAYPVDDAGRRPATFAIATATGWAPAASQPKPLRPGSARQRLAHALGVPEQSAGEKAGPDSAEVETTRRATLKGGAD